MTRIYIVAALLAALIAKAHAQDPLTDLAWAYALTTAAPPEPLVDDGSRHSLQGTERTFTLDEIRARFAPADWYPQDHPEMPRIVAVGDEQRGIWACSMCHYPNGKGRPENAGVAGLPVEYFVQQMRDFGNGTRRSSDPQKANTLLMIAFGSAMTAEEMREAAEYFGAMSWTPWIEVVETDVVPKTRIAGGMHLVLEGSEAGMEPLGARIIETPRSAERTEVLRDPRSGFIAYVPRGSVARGAKLASTGGEGKTTACAICHGDGLNGLAFVPTLRGRSPSYIARQLGDFKSGARNGAWAPLMGPVVAQLSAADILDLAAYLASLPPEE